MRATIPRFLQQQPSLAALALTLCLALLLNQPPAFGADKTITLNLKDADITSVISTVSEMTGKNFIIDPRVKGKVTIISSRPLKADEIYQVLLAVLNVHGYAAVRDKDMIKIVPEVNAKQSAIPNATDKHPGNGDEYVTRVIAVDNVAAVQLVPILRPLLPQEAHLAAYPGSNVLIASGDAANIERLVQIIHRIDVADDTNIDIVPLKHASADDVVRILTAMLQGNDKGNVNPTEVPKLSADLRTNSVLISGDRSHRARLKAIIASLDTPTEHAGNTRVFYLHYANAKDLVPVLTGLSDTLSKGAQKGKAATAGTGDTLSIQADDSINALVITAPPDIMSNLVQVIHRLDIRRAQVLVEAIIAEVSADKSRELGVQWLFNSTQSNGPVGIVNFSGSDGHGLTDLAAAASTGSVSGNGLIAAIGDTSGATGIAALLRALSGDSHTNVLSTPSLVTLDNQEASIVVGQNVPIVTGSYSGTGTSSTPTTPFQTYSREDVGITLKIKPQINEGNTVRLDIDQEVSQVVPTSSGNIADLTTNKRSIKTTVMADSGHIIVLGGLIDNQLTQNEQKVPLLGDIPLLGNLFSYKQTTKTKRNLMIFIRPVILRTPDDNLAVTGGKYNYIRERQLAVRKEGVNLMSDDNVPVLPKWDDKLALPPPFDPNAPASDADPGADTTSIINTTGQANPNVGKHPG